MDFPSLSDYQFLSVLGRGAMGVVYKALYCGREVAVKVLSERLVANPEVAQRFFQEMRVVMELDHPNIVKAIDFGVDLSSKLYFVALEYIDGESLKERLDRLGALPLGMSLEILKAVAEGLEAAYQHGVVHRDIKPENILLDRLGGVKIVDFGLVKAEYGADLTKVGDILGTPYYISPEQARAEEVVDIRSDIYSLGITFYHMLAGRPPYVYDTPMRVIAAHCFRPLPPVSDFTDRELPGEVLELLERMTQKDPVDRYSRPSEVSAAVEEVRERIATRRWTTVWKRLTDTSSSRSGWQSLTGSLSGTLTNLVGKVQVLSLPHLVEVLARSKRTGILRIRPLEGEEGSIFFRGGLILNCFFDGEWGEGAFYRILEVDRGEFAFREVEPEVEKVIEMEPGTLLLEGLRRLDERGLGCSEVPRMETEKGILGKLGEIGVLEVVHSLVAVRQTGILHLRKWEGESRRKARVFFLGGEIVQAEFEGVYGLDAFFDLVEFCWGGGSFYFRYGEFEQEREIYENSVMILMECARRLSEG